MNVPSVHRPRKARWIVLGAVGFIVLAAGGVFLDAWVSAGRALDRSLADSDRRTEELRKPRSIAALLEPSAEGNAWTPVVAALESVNALSALELEPLPSFYGESDEVDAPLNEEAIGRIVSKVTPAFETLKESLHRTWMDQGRTYDQPGGDLGPKLGCFRMARLLADSAGHFHRSGRDLEALDALMLGYGLADRVAFQGSVIKEMVRHAIVEILHPVVGEILISHEWRAEDLRRASVFFDRLERSRPPLIECLRWEDGGIRRLLVKLGRREHHPGALEDDKWYRRCLPLRIQAAQWLGWQELMMRHHERIGALDPWKRREAIAALGSFEGMPPQVEQTFGAILFRIWKQGLEVDVTLALTRFSIAVAHFQAIKGAYPSRQEDLVPEFLAVLPVDPFSGKQLKYVNRGDSALVYSLAEDGDDDGGRAEETMSEERDGDRIMQIGRRKK